MRPLRRRLAALLVQLLILQGAFLGGAAACQLTTSKTSSATAVATAHHGAHHGAHHDARHDTSSAAVAPAAMGHATAEHERSPHDAPASSGEHAPSHCAAVGACATAALGGRTVALPASVVILATRADLSELDAPASVSTAPEPPPPRA